MANYLIFFGKSQAFETVAYDESGLVANFDRVIPDFDLLESKWLVIDQPDVKPIFARYNFQVANKSYCLFKSYAFAQAFVGSRIEGSIFGVAILSDSAIGVTKNNLQILKTLLKSFRELCLVKSKFKTPFFAEETKIIWNAFVDQIGFSKIDQGPRSAPSTAPSSPAAVHVKEIDQFGSVPNSSVDGFDRLYFSEDLSFLRRVSAKWNGVIKLFQFDHGQLSLYIEPSRIEPLKGEIKGASADRSSNLAFSETEAQLKRINNQYRQLRARYRKIFVLFIFLAALSFVFLIYRLYGSLFEKENLPKIVTPPAVVVQTTMSAMLVDSVLRDTARINRLQIFMRDFMVVARTRDTLVRRSKRGLLFKKANELGIDSNQLIRVLYK
jgi:hypothetical protein